MTNNENHPKSFDETFNENYSILDAFFFISMNKIDIEDDIQNHANLLAQKSFVHACSLRNLYSIFQSPFELPVFESSLFKKKLNASDVLSEFVLLRAQYETFLTFSYIFVYSESEEEKLSRYYLWQLAGLKSRQNIIQNSLFGNDKLEIIKDEKEKIKLIISKIKTIYSSKNPTELLNGKFHKYLEKDRITWRKNFINMKKLSWNDIAKYIRLNQKYSEKMYSYLSWFAHSEYTSIQQFKDLYKTDYKNDFLKLCFQFSNLILCSLIIDYCKIFEYAKNNFDLLPENIREYIAFNNEVVRNKRI